jgi:hypothetical protein
MSWLLGDERFHGGFASEGCITGGHDADHDGRGRDQGEKRQKRREMSDLHSSIGVLLQRRP